MRELAAIPAGCFQENNRTPKPERTKAPICAATLRRKKLQTRRKDAALRKERILARPAPQPMSAQDAGGQARN